MTDPENSQPGGALGTYDRPIEIADGVHWIGFFDEHEHLHCNPYLVVAGDEAVLIDGGSRADFATVMTKILQVGISPDRIVALVYQHYDPDLCGSMSNLLDLCRNPELAILTDTRNRSFLSHYLNRERRGRIRTLDDFDHRLRFGGRELTFVNTPYAHSAGSFVTHDPATATLFGSDLFGSFGTDWSLHMQLDPDCHECIPVDPCPCNGRRCPLVDLGEFHRSVMPSCACLRHALEQMSGLTIDQIAPQHGSVISGSRDIARAMGYLRDLEGVGIDAIIPPR
jgi:flavorubredoxin